jgi:hypothetical protein
MAHPCTAQDLQAKDNKNTQDSEDTHGHLPAKFCGIWSCGGYDPIPLRLCLAPLALLSGPIVSGMHMDTIIHPAGVDWKF